MYYTIYKTTNLIDGKIYIGCHKTEDLDDGYLGSGKYLKHAINKHGIDNFTKDILQVFDNPEDMFEMESQLVNEDFVKDKTTYNLKVGGEGGFDYINKNRLNHKDHDLKAMSLLGKKNRLAALKWLFENDPVFVKKHSENVSNGLKKYYTENGHPWTGRRHTEESKKKIGKANSILQKGKGNNQYGMMWICNHELKENTRILKTDPIPDGWVKGRKINW